MAGINSERMASLVIAPVLGGIANGPWIGSLVGATWTRWALFSWRLRPSEGGAVVPDIRPRPLFFGRWGCALDARYVMSQLFGSTRKSFG